MTVAFLTGGTGLLGLHILDALVARGQPVRALARTPDAAESLRRRGAEPVLGRLEDPRVWNELTGARALIHAAALVYGTTDWAEYRRVNVDATRRAAESARRLGIPLIHISSVAVYGPRGRVAPGSLAEDAPLGSTVDGAMYARSKRLAEAAVWEECARGLTAIVLRPCVVYGEGDRLFLPNLVRRAKRGWLPVIGDGRATLPLVYAGNVAQAVVAALESPGGWGRAYNVTNDGEITGAELVALIERGLGQPVRGVPIPRAVARGAAWLIDLSGSLGGSGLPGLQAAVRFLGDGNPYTSAAARSHLGWAPSEPHVAALPRAIESLGTPQFKATARRDRP